MTNKEEGNKVFILIGISGSGKSHIAKKLVKQLGVTEINVGETMQLMSRTENDYNKYILKKLRSALHNKKNVILSDVILDVDFIKSIIEKFESQQFVIIVLKDSFDEFTCYNRIKQDIESGVERTRVPFHVVLKQNQTFEAIQDDLYKLEEDWDNVVIQEV